MMPRFMRAMPVLFTVMITVSCAAPAEPLPVVTPAPAATAPANTPQATVQLTGTASVLPPEMQPTAVDPVEAAAQQLASELNVSENALILVDSEPVEWNDTSLGCPQPGQTYLQVLTSGYRVRFDVDGDVYAVHTDMAGSAIVCYRDSTLGETETFRDPIAAEFIEVARADLAERLSVGRDAVEFIRSEPVEWRDSRVGCAVPEGTEVIVTPTKGYRIILMVAERQYEYHTDQQRIKFCADPIE